MCLTNPSGKGMPHMVNKGTYKHISLKRISGAAVRSVLSNVIGVVI